MLGEKEFNVMHNQEIKVTVQYLDRDKVKSEMIHMGLMHLESEPDSGKCIMTFQGRDLTVPQVAVALRGRIGNSSFLRVVKGQAN